MIYWILGIFILIILIVGGLVLWRLPKVPNEPSNDLDEVVEHSSYPLPVSEERGIKGARQKTRKPSYGETGRGLRRIVNRQKNTVLLILIITVGFTLTSCLATKNPDPVTIEIPCNLAPLKPIPTLYSTEFIGDETCSHYVCYSEQEFKKEFENDVISEAYIKYLTGTYNDAKRRCEGHE